MKIAVQGCAHGELENIYATLQHAEAHEGIKTDLLICCGDFQAVRNEADLESLACPVKFRAMNTFWKYYAGIEKAPYPTLFVGGNHEASNYLWELFYGGWAAPNIFFLGFAGVVRFGGLRIGGLSGIYKPHDYHAGHFERPPYNNSDMRSVYHIREYEVRKLLEVREPLDVMLSHDWPRGVTAHGNQRELLQRKPFFRDEVQKNILGSAPSMKLLTSLQPSYWFAAHLHVKFAALVQHSSGQTTKFLALDKCLPRKHFLQVVDFPNVDGPLEFSYDEEWLAITRAYHPFMPLSRAPAQYPKVPIDVESHREWVKCQLSQRSAVVPNNFCVTVPLYDPQRRTGGRGGFPAAFSKPSGVKNPQTEAFLNLLELPFTLDTSPPSGSEAGWKPPMRESGQSEDDSVLDDVDEMERAKSEPLADPDEIPLEDDLEEEEGGG